MTDQCPLCLDKYTATSRKKVKCQFCPAVSCRTCLQTHILNAVAEPACYACKREWNTEFMNDTFGVTFRTKTLRVHRRKIVEERERALLPSMQFFVGLQREINLLRAKVDALLPTYSEHSAKYNIVRGNMIRSRNQHTSLFIKQSIGPLSAEDTEAMREAGEDFKKYSIEMEEYHRTEYLPISTTYHAQNSRLNRLIYTYKTGEVGAEKKERREFIMRCPGTDCRGFLSTGYKCGTCSRKTCSECTEVIDEDSETEHKCKPESVESTKAIKKETRPCPKCAAPIYKIDGCDQMWCTNGGCNTAFSWDTGRVVTGRVHNPHYYEWIRRTGGGEAPREIGDIPCGGVPAYALFSQPFFSKYTVITSKVRNPLFEIHRHIVEIEEGLARYPQQAPALMNKEINVRYLMNEITEEAWVVALEHADAKFQKKREIGQILHTLVTAAADILRNVHTRMTEPGTDHTIPGWIDHEIMPTLESLRTYTNEIFKKLGKANRSAAPQISGRWQLLAPKRLDKNTIVEGGQVVPLLAPTPSPN
jgi:hypothetical protein